MCGRAAQTYEAVSVAGAALMQQSSGNASHGSGNQNSRSTNDVSQNSAATNAASTTVNSSSNQATLSIGTNQSTLEDYHNYNMSPGMDAFVFWYDNKTNEIRVDKKVWGIVPKGGTPSAPLPEGMGKHFEGLMFNARSDTLYEKPTFSRLAKSGKSCLVALDGFFEWKAELKGRKQPYFVYRNTKNTSGDQGRHPYLLMPGLWTSVPTGRSDNPVLETFTIITTDVCNPLKWLHTRMPITIWDDKLAMMWLKSPSEHVHRQMDESAQSTPDDYFAWHAVTPDMTSMKFRSDVAIKPLPKMKTVKSFFTTPSATKAATNDNKSKGKRPSEEISSSPTKTYIVSSPNFVSTTNNKPTGTRAGDKVSPPTPTKTSSISSPNVVSSSHKKPKPGTIESFFKRK